MFHIGILYFLDAFRILSFLFFTALTAAINVSSDQLPTEVFLIYNLGILKEFFGTPNATIICVKKLKQEFYQEKIN